MSERGHVPVESLDEYRQIKKAADALDRLRDWYLTRGHNAPSEVRTALGHLDALRHSLRVPIGKSGRKEADHE